MKDGRTKAHHGSGYQDGIVTWCERECDKSNQRDAHADNERIGFGMSVRIGSDHRLKYRANHLEGQRDQADLGKTQAKGFLEQRIDGWKQRLNSVVEQVAK